MFLLRLRVHPASQYRKYSKNCEAKIPIKEFSFQIGIFFVDKSFIFGDDFGKNWGIIDEKVVWCKATNSNSKK